MPAPFVQSPSRALHKALLRLYYAAEKAIIKVPGCRFLEFRAEKGMNSIHSLFLCGRICPRWKKHPSMNQRDPQLKRAKKRKSGRRLFETPSAFSG
ncbi:MAG TPA: hypothetical protein DC013_10450 [Ruminococcaceae bacterium]|nr:hypothetical protein [Oscillospiraceae bacterium]